MRAVLQRVHAARVSVDGRTVGAIDRGLVVFAAVGEGDTDIDLDWIADKIATLRLFPDEAGRFDRSLSEVGASVLAISQFTLFGDCRKGRRPSFSHAAEPETAREQFARLVTTLRERGLTVAEGEFGAMMRVEVDNDGPVTILLDSSKTF